MQGCDSPPSHCGQEVHLGERGEHLEARAATSRPGAPVARCCLCAAAQTSSSCSGGGSSRPRAPRCAESQQPPPAEPSPATCATCGLRHCPPDATRDCVSAGQCGPGPWCLLISLPTNACHLSAMANPSLRQVNFCWAVRAEVQFQTIITVHNRNEMVCTSGTRRRQCKPAAAVRRPAGTAPGCARSAPPAGAACPASPAPG